jgi:hypothetical protein
MANDIKVLTISDQQVQRRGDIEIPLDGAGQFKDNPTLVSGLSKANQDLAKGLLTIIGSNYLAPNYGTNLQTLVSSRKLDDVADRITSDIQLLLAYLANFNVDQPSSEQFLELIDLQAEETLDTIELNLTVRTGLNETTTLAI